MLVLACKKGQNIIIHNDEGLHIVVTVTDTHGKKAILGFTASKGIAIDREKVFESKKKGAL